MIETCQTTLREPTQIIEKEPRPVPAPGEAPEALAPSATLATEKSRKAIAPYLTLPIWAWFLIGLGFVILLPLLASLLG